MASPPPRSLAMGGLGLGIALGVASGCALLAGIDDGNTKTDAKDASAAADGRAASGDGGAGGDAGDPAAPCVAPSAVDSLTRIHAPKVQAQAPVQINGDGAEWKCVDTLPFTAGQLIVGLAEGRGVAAVAMQWDETSLYLFADVTTGSPGGNAPSASNFNNDSFAFYVSGPNPGATYTASDHHYVVDSLSQLADYAIATRPPPKGITAQAGTVRDDGTTLRFVVEARVDAATVGRTAFAKGDVVRVNFQINDQPVVANNYRIWFHDPTRCVASGGCPKGEPYCDPRCTGEVELR